ncbi:hypothetical protein [Streptomyces griseoaurantiacus]|uniref:hypothetical protein n=1 Tax=Streptomyces griseoaurantiacus TaxID=68213 RepID=UPI00386A1267
MVGRTAETFGCRTASKRDQSCRSVWPRRTRRFLRRAARPPVKRAGKPHTARPGLPFSKKRGTPMKNR